MAEEIRLNRRKNTSTTQISNEFIDRYMVDANGEYVKVYLYLLRCFNADLDNLSIASIADHFDDTEKDVKRALQYWEKMNLLHLEYDGKMLTSIDILDIPEKEEKEERVKLKRSTTKKNTKPEVKPSDSYPEGVIKDLFFSTEQYLRKTLTQTERDIINYFLDELQFSPELIEYLITYCVDNDYKNMKTIQKIALSWHEEGITSKEEAQKNIIFHSKPYFAVMKAFGIKGRNLNDLELHFLNRWTDEYHFQEDIIKEACERTISNTNQPSFKYAECILSTWKNSKVKSISDIEALDAAHKADASKTSKTKVKVAASTNKFNNFKQRNYDYDALERQLLGNVSN